MVVNLRVMVAQKQCLKLYHFYPSGVILAQE